MTDDAAIGKVIQGIRQELGMSQLRLCELLRDRGFHWYQQTITRIESGARPLKAVEMFALADALGVGVDAFRTRDFRTAALKARHAALMNVLRETSALKNQIEQELEGVND